MKIKIQGFINNNHSWSIVHWNLARAFIKMGHEVHLFPTDLDKKNHIPEELKQHVKDKFDNDYFLQLSYTAPINFGKYLDPKNSQKSNYRKLFGIWNYEYRGTGILPGFAKNYKYTDKILPSSNFSKDVFLDMGVPEDHLVVVPHGINLEDFENKNKYPIKSTKRVKILLNIAQPHKRKNIPDALKCFGKAFNKNDDVCLVAKISTSNKKDFKFDVDFYELYRDFIKEYPSHADVEIITTFIPDITKLYNACDINFSATHAECWHLPSLEALAAGIVNVVPRYGGILDFCSDNNSLLINGSIKRAPRDHLYWMTTTMAQHFVIDTNDAVEKLRYTYNNCEELKLKFKDEMKQTANQFTWDNAANKILKI